MARKFLRPTHIQVLLGLSAHLLPSRGPAVKRLPAKIILHMEYSLRELPALLRRLFLLGLAVFDCTPLVLSPAHRCFRNLPEQAQERFLHTVQTHRLLAPLQSWLFAARGLILLCYYSQPEVMAVLEYTPEHWARQKVRARRRALRLLESEHLEPRKLKKLRADYS